MSIFDDCATAALSTAFRIMASDAVYEPPTGPVVTSLRVIVGKADDVADIGSASFVAPERVVEVRKSQLAAPTKGGVFAVSRNGGGTDRYVITAKPKIEDPDGLVWTCLCDPE